MKFVGVDLHKKTISICVVGKVRGELKVLDRKRFACRPTEMITKYLKTLGRIQLTVESTIGYEWFAALVEPLCNRGVIAHPAKLRVIAESTRKTDKIDVVLAELGDVRRFRNSSQITSSAGLAPGVRESASKRRDLGISQAGSRMLRWAMIQLAWRVIRQSTRWNYRYEKLKARKGSKKAITAIARRQLVIVSAKLRRGEP
jgi:hypothetical protein